MLYTHSCILYITGVTLNVTIMRYTEPSCKGSSSQEVLCLKVTLNIFPEAVVSVPLRIMPPLGRVTSLLAETFKGYNSLLEQLLVPFHSVKWPLVAGSTSSAVTNQGTLAVT